MILNNVNLDLKLGDVISISGDKSCGKSTLLKLITGLYSPGRGSILVNGKSASKFPARELIRHVGYLAMEGAIFKGTIAENLTAFGEIPENQVQEVVGLLGLDKEIEKLPAGYETNLDGSETDVIPPGLKQRIAIARVLSTKPRIILFDNADRSLDKEGYNQVYKLLARLKGKATMIICSDDRNILRLAMHDYVLVDGTLKPKESIGDSKLYDVTPYRRLRI
jgi:ATP-binding cassette subfamily C protein LapB